MPNPGELIGRIVAWVGELINDSSLRLGIAPTVSLLVVVLVLLSLVARPSSRWITSDPGRLSGLGRGMALAAEAGATAVLSLGTAGVARATSAAERLQTLAVLPLVDHVARAAARAGVQIRITTDDAVVAGLVEGAVEEAHAVTGTPERRTRSDVEFIGEGRLPSAGLALGAQTGRVTGFVLGGAAEESLLLMHGLADGPSGARIGTADVAQAGSVLLEGAGTLVGADLFAAPADLRATGHARTAVAATNRLVWLAVGVIVLAAGWALAGGDPRSVLGLR